MTAARQPRSPLLRAATVVGRLTHRPGCLLALLLAVNAVARPYANLAHDARLYSVQVLNRLEGGTFADDLFLRYGSQDQFSLFSTLVALPVALLGLRNAFFLLYLGFNALFFLALMRLVLALLRDRAVAVAALLYLAVVPLPFGGLYVFTVHESFLTPRLLANALVLFALERVVRGRFTAALALLVPALLAHPLMALPGCLIWAGCLAVQRCHRQLLIASVASAAVLGTALLAYEPLGVRVFGAMDEDWRAMVRDASAYNFPALWTGADWLNVAVSLAVPALAAGSIARRDVRSRRFMLVALAVGAVGLAGTVLGAVLPYALLFQGQPYRALWVLKALQIPLGFVLIRRWAGAESVCHRLTALGLLFYFGLGTFLPAEVALPVIILPILLLRAWAIGEDCSSRPAMWRLGATAIVAAAFAWTAFIWAVLIAFRGEFIGRLEALDYAQRFVGNVGPYCWLIVIGWGLHRVLSRGMRPWVFTAVAVALCVAYQGIFYVVPNVGPYRAACTRDGADVAFAQDFLARQRGPAGALPTVYSVWGRIDYVWVDLHAKSYFDWAQVVGVIFERRTAEEGRRRAALVRRFEMDRLRGDAVLIPDVFKESLVRLFGAGFDCSGPTRDDLARLCREPGVDYLILKHEFPGLAAAQNGRVFIYDCRQVRAALDGPGAGPALAAATRPGAPHARGTDAP